GDSSNLGSLSAWACMTRLTRQRTGAGGHDAVMIGGEALVRTLVACGGDVGFMNPGTSEMHFVAALDSVPEMRGVLALFEGVATGAAHRDARVSGRQGATLLH